MNCVPWLTEFHWCKRGHIWGHFRQRRVLPSVEVPACGEFVDVRAPLPEGSCVPCVSGDISTDGSRTSFLDVDKNSKGGNVMLQGETSPFRAEIAVAAAQCCGTSTRTVNGQVRQCNSMCLCVVRVSMQKCADTLWYASSARREFAAGTQACTPAPTCFRRF